MPYQLIYTSAARLLDSPLSGYGVVARSEPMPTSLVRTLIEMSEYKEPADQGIHGPQFSYHVVECLNTLYHIFTCVRPAGADYSKRSCHLAHHLALRADEMHALCRGAEPPTPAGILLSLELRRYWVHHWQKAPEHLGENTIPPLWENPSAVNSPTWQIFTGNADNARILVTPPFHQGCLVVVPQKSQSRDILRLLHESYTLSPTLGWGISFCTYSVEGDSLESSLRLFTVAGSALCQRAMRTGFPMLELTPGLKFIPQSSPAPQPIPPSGMAPRRMQQAPPPPRSASVPPPAAAAAPATPHAEALPLSALTNQQYYSYAEDRSNDIFEHPWRREKRSVPVLLLLYGLAALALCAAGIALCLLLTSAPPTEQPAPPADTAPPQVALPTPSEKPADLPPLPIQPTEPPADTPVADAPEPPKPIPPTPQPPEPPPATDTPVATPDDYPDDAPEDDPEADNTPTPPVTLSAADFRESACQAIFIGKELPRKLLEILPLTKGSSVSLHYGEYRVHVSDKKPAIYNQDRHTYSAEGYTSSAPFLKIHSISESKYRIIPIGETQIPAVTLHLRGNKLSGITTDDGAPAALQLAVADETSREIHRFILLAQVNLQLHVPAAESPLPKMTQPLVFNEKMVDFGKGSQSFSATLNLEECRNENPYIRKLRGETKRNARLTSQLPDVCPGFRNELVITDSKNENSYAYRLKDGESTVFYRVGAELKYRFDKYLSKPEGMPMSRVLQLIIGMRNKKPTDATLRDYIQKFNQDAEMERILRTEIFREIPDCCSAHVPQNAGSQDWKNEITRLKKTLNEKNRKEMLAHLKAYLSKELTGILSDIYREYNVESSVDQYFYLHLKDVELSKGQLKWSFELEEQKK